MNNYLADRRKCIVNYVMVLTKEELYCNNGKVLIK